MGGRMCRWTKDDDGMWTAICGRSFQFTWDGPTRNGFNYCPYCGSRLDARYVGDLPAGPTPQQIVELWNDIVTPPIPTVRKLTAGLQKKITARLKSFPDLDDWQAVIRWVEMQPWCRKPGTGTHPTWAASLHWLVKSDETFGALIDRVKADRESPQRVTTMSMEGIHRA